MKVAITGGTGFIGRHLAQLLVADGHEVVLLGRGHDRREETARNGIAGFVTGDLSDQQVLAKAFAGCEAVAHCAQRQEGPHGARAGLGPLPAGAFLGIDDESPAGGSSAGTHSFRRRGGAGTSLRATPC